MSTQLMRSLAGPVHVVDFPESLPKTSFADRFRAAGFTLPDQATMRLMMRATVVLLPWDAKESDIIAREKRPFEGPWDPMVIFTFDQYRVVPNFQMGAPMPNEIRRHINKVRAEFPKAEVLIHAHPKEDPFVEITLGGESLLTAAWWRHLETYVIYTP